MRRKPSITGLHFKVFREKGYVMKCNTGSIDRIVRVVLGAGLIAASLLGIIGVWGWIGIVPLVTGLVGVCPAYLPFGVSTCSSEPKPKR